MISIIITDYISGITTLIKDDRFIVIKDPVIKNQTSPNISWFEITINGELFKLSSISISNSLQQAIKSLEQFSEIIVGIDQGSSTITTKDRVQTITYH